MNQYWKEATIAVGHRAYLARRNGLKLCWGTITQSYSLRAVKIAQHQSGSGTHIVFR
jgi:hypothetical protein